MRTLDYFFREKKNKVLKVALFGYLTLFFAIMWKCLQKLENLF